MLEQIKILMLAGAGFSLSSYIAYAKSKNQKLVCLVGKECDKVVQSRYSKTFGVPNEFLGMAYYSVIIVYAMLSAFSVSVAPLELIFSVFSGAAALFSLYLIAVQIFVIRELCEWCLTSAALSSAIFFLVYF